jgi:tRNA nucleotidyltransferase (CCA-adding enzyme)
MSGPTPIGLLTGVRPDLAITLGRAATIAAARGDGLWLIGGAVRDLLRGAALDRDIDLAVEGDAVGLADQLAEALGGRVLASHRAFGTATIALPSPDSPFGELTFDLAAARAEEYPQPAVLPVVRPATIADDLRRRDFSVNAIAVELLDVDGGLRTGMMRDPFGGRADLAAGRLRLLHPHSLRDDPTRMLRGLRLASRLNLLPDAATAAQVADALAQGYLSLLTPERALAEICLALDEPQPDAVLALSDAWGVTPQIAPGLAWSEALATRFARAREAGQLSAIGYRLSAMYAGLLCYDLSAADLAGLAGRYPLPTPFARLLKEIPAARAVARKLDDSMRPSQIDLLLRSLSEATITMLRYAETASASQIIARYLHAIRPARAPLDGRDMQRLGVAPGPMIGRLLDELRAAHLDSEVTTREQAERWVREQIA